MLALLLLPHARAWSSETQPVALHDLADLFNSAEFSTGFVPSGSPIAVQFAIESTGGAAVDMTGDADMTWPDAFRLDYTSAPGNGELQVEASIDAVTTLQVDLSDWGYSGTWELDRRGFPISASTTFEPFVLEGSAEPRVEVTDPGASNQLIYYSYDIVPGLSVDFAAYVRTETTVGLEGHQWQVNEATLTQDGEAAVLAPDPVADYLVDSVYSAGWDATLSLIVTPSAEVCTAFGCVTLLEFDIPIDLLTDAFDQDFPNAQQVFPLPLLQMDAVEGDVGDVALGGIANLDVPIHNDGSLLLTGTARVEGSADFSVFPTDFTAIPGGEDGVVVTFHATTEGSQQALLILDSNDPTQPTLSFTLTANGQAVDVGYDTGEDIQKALPGCGCVAADGRATVPLLVLAGLLMGGLHRRRG